MRLILALTFGSMLAFVGCSSSDSERNEETASRACTEPENPYTEGTGHYAGYEWAANDGGPSCNGPSQSFNEGCEEYEEQEAEYEACMRKKK